MGGGGGGGYGRTRRTPPGYGPGLTSCNNGFVQSSAEGAIMVAKFQHYDEKMAKILDDCVLSQIKSRKARPVKMSWT